MTLIAIEEHWIMPELTAALRTVPRDREDDTLAFNDLDDHQERLQDLGAGRIAAMDAQGRRRPSRSSRSSRDRFSRSPRQAPRFWTRPRPYA
jgi:hypothetical protein